MLISHFTVLQSKKVSVFVRARKAEADRKDESAADLDNLLLFISVSVNEEVSVSLGVCSYKKTSSMFYKVSHTTNTLTIYSKLMTVGLEYTLFLSSCRD